MESKRKSNTIVLILIILGLIIGFNKLRGDREDYDEESQTYY